MTPEHELESEEVEVLESEEDEVLESEEDEAPESEEDEAPEEVTFQNARSRAEESARLRREVAKREKDLLKEKRKRKQSLFSEQKKKKLLSDDILQTVAALPDKLDEPSDDTQEKDSEKKERQGKKRLAKKLRPRKSLQTRYEVVHLDDENASDLQQERAKSFLQNTLYGKNKNRTTTNEFLSISRKKGAVKMPSFQFTDNSWGEEEKKKATNFNLRWRNGRMF